VFVASGVTVGVGAGIFSTIPTESPQSAANPFSRMMLVIDTSKAKAIAPHVSPGLTSYELGVGVGGGGLVAVGGSGVVVRVTVGVSVGVGPSVGSTTPPVRFKAA
jgi:hypothetical protein